MLGDYPDINFGGFEGCIRDIVDNNQMYDLFNPLYEKNTELGCKLANNPCPDCNGQGYCEPLWTNSICVCDLGFTGPNCNSSKKYRSCYFTEAAWPSGLGRWYCNPEVPSSSTPPCH